MYLGKKTMKFISCRLPGSSGFTLPPIRCMIFHDSNFLNHLFLYLFFISSGSEGNGNPLQYSCLENPRTEEPRRLQSMGSLRVVYDWVTSLSLFTFLHWEGNGNPLQCSCLENPMDGGVWWAAISGVAQCRTRLKQLSSSSISSGRPTTWVLHWKRRVRTEKASENR